MTQSPKMLDYVPLHAHSCYSFLDGVSKPESMAKHCKKMGLKGCAITDHGSISGAVSFYNACIKQGIKPILGCEFYLVDGDPTIKDKNNKKLSHLCVLAKNDGGWKQLIKAVSTSNLCFYHKPRLSIEAFSPFAQDGNLIAFSGHPGSDLANVIFDGRENMAYNAKTYDDAKKLVRADWFDACKRMIERYIEVFGRDNFFLEIQLIDQDRMPASTIIASILRHMGKKLNVPCLATPDAHYLTREQTIDQRVLLCTRFRTNFREVAARLESDDDYLLSTFFNTNSYHIPTLEEMNGWHTEDELENTIRVFDSIGEYQINHPPRFPKFDVPDGLDEKTYFERLCWEGFNLRHKGKPNEDMYRERLHKEMDVIKRAGLCGYFLIVRDYVKWAENQGWLVGPGRGSVGGSLVAFDLGITKIDPIPFGLIFERFYNEGRNTDGNISLPDIDCDFPTRKREHVIDYIRQKYGRENVCQMATFSRMQGRMALKDIFRAHGIDNQEEIKQIVEYIPNESEISDQLQEMKEETGESSIIQWALENNEKELSHWCRIDDNGKLVGEYAPYFAQAIRMEGTKRGMGKHPAGVIISTEPIAELVPMVKPSNTDDLVAGFDMKDMESMGHTKFDILGVSVLDKIQGVRSLLATGNF